VARATDRFGETLALANIPAVLIGDKLSDKLPLKAIRLAPAAVLAALGLMTLSGVKLW